MTRSRSSSTPAPPAIKGGAAKESDVSDHKNQPLTKAERDELRHYLAAGHVPQGPCEDIVALLDAADALDELKAEVQRVIDGMPPEGIWQHLDTVKEQLRAALNHEAKK